MTAPNQTDDGVLDTRLDLIDKGYLILPCNGKAPVLMDWSQVRATAQYARNWERKPEARNTGILTGEVVAIDVDFMHPDLAARLCDMVRALPGGADAPMRIGKAPKAMFLFRTDEPREKDTTDKFKIDGTVQLIEVMGDGQQVIVDGIHPETGKPYTWDRPLPVVADLPTIDWPALEALLTQAGDLIAPYADEIKSAPAPRIAANDNAGDSYWERVNTAALGNLDAWVQALDLPKTKRRGKTYRAVAEWRGVRNANLSFHPDGIRDYGDDKGYTPISVVIAAGVADEAPEAAEWLCNRMGIRREDLGWEGGGADTPPCAKSVEALLAKGREPAGAEPGATKTAAANDNERFKITWFDDIADAKPKETIIKGAFGVNEFTVVSGLPGSGKSVILTDAACHVACGADWHGRKVKRGLVVYVAAERKALTERRMLAFRKRHGVAHVPLVVLGGRIDLTRDLADAKELIEAVEKLEEIADQKCVWVIIDTLTRVFGAGDQNASKDMSRFVQSVDEILDKTTAHVTAVHHTGWSGERGKGAIDLDGAVDASFLVKKQGSTYALICDGTNDGEEGAICRFTMEGVTVGVDEDGEPTTAPVVVPGEGAGAGLAGKLRGHQAKALEALTEAVAAEGIPPDGPGFSDDAVVVGEKAWRETFYRMSDAGVAQGTLKTRFARARTALIASNAVEQIGEWYRPV